MKSNIFDSIFNRRDDSSDNRVNPNGKTTAPTNSPEYDKSARKKQIHNAACETFKDRLDSFVTILLLTVEFCTGAEWADENPKASFVDGKAWFNAQRTFSRAYHSEMYDELDLAAEGSILLAFSMGCSWAEAHPAK